GHLTGLQRILRSADEGSRPSRMEQAPGVVLSAGTDVRPGDVRPGLLLAEVAERVELSENRHGQDVDRTRSEDHVVIARARRRPGWARARRPDEACSGRCGG